MIELEAVTKSYGRRGARVALQDVDLAIGGGECVVASGPSGAGKTTLLRLIGAMTQPDAGVVRLFGRDPSRLRRSSLPQLRRRVAAVMHDPGLLADDTAIANVGVALEVRGLARRDIGARAAEALAAVGLSAHANEPVVALSAGARQRVAIARAVVGAPSLLLLDEPSAALDPEGTEALVRLLCDLQRDDVTAVVTSNDPLLIDAADRLGWRRFHIEAGRVHDIDIPIIETAPESERRHVVPFPVAASARGHGE